MDEVTRNALLDSARCLEFHARMRARYTQPGFVDDPNAFTDATVRRSWRNALMLRAMALGGDVQEAAASYSVEVPR